NREPAGLTLKYGELKQILQDPTVTFQKVKVGRAEIRGEILTRDPTSDGDKNSPHSEAKSFHAPRTGLELDTELQSLLDERIGAAYQGEDEVSALQNVSSLIFSFILFVSLGVALFMAVRWISGGNSPLTFGRSRHKLYAEKDLAITFQ